MYTTNRVSNNTRAGIHDKGLEWCRVHGIVPRGTRSNSPVMRAGQYRLIAVQHVETAVSFAGTLGQGGGVQGSHFFPVQDNPV